MEYVEGASLATRLRTARWRSSRRPVLTEVLARAVQAAHDATC